MADQNNHLLTVADIGELALIERLKPFCAEGVVGDDAALVEVSAGQRLVVTTDVLIDGVHFSDRTTPAFTVGWRSVAANLSDLAAMGAAPSGITVGLGLPQDTPWHWVEALYEGMVACLKNYGGCIVGGDVCRAGQRTVAITALGQVPVGRSVARSRAKPGMVVVATGVHGASRAGLAVLQGEIEVPEQMAVAWIRAHQQPVPRFDAITCLNQLTSAMDSFPAMAGMDSSDGLANALLQIGQSSGVGMTIRRSRIPLPVGLSESIGADRALEWALYGGEDFELVLCLWPELAAQFCQVSGAIEIGAVTNASGVITMLESAQDSTGMVLGHQGFEHF